MGSRYLHKYENLDLNLLIKNQFNDAQYFMTIFFMSLQHQMETVKQLLTYTAYSSYLWTLHDVKQQISIFLYKKLCLHYVSFSCIRIMQMNLSLLSAKHQRTFS